MVRKSRQGSPKSPPSDSTKPSQAHTHISHAPDFQKQAHRITPPSQGSARFAAAGCLSRFHDPRFFQRVYSSSLPVFPFFSFEKMSRQTHGLDLPKLFTFFDCTTARSDDQIAIRLPTCVVFGARCSIAAPINLKIFVATLRHYGYSLASPPDAPPLGAITGLSYSMIHSFPWYRNDPTSRSFPMALSTSFKVFSSNESPTCWSVSHA
jgi:hypothetical protein